MKKINFIFSIWLLVLNGKSQITIDTAYFYLDTNLNLYMPKQKVHLNEIINNNLNVFKASQAYTFQKTSEFNFSGTKFTKFNQYFNGIRIDGNSYIISSKFDTIQNIGGRVLFNSLPTTSGFISQQNAIQSLTASLNYFKYKWQDSLWESEIKTAYSDSLATYFPKTQLTIFKNLSNNYDNVNEYYYAYPINISALKSSVDSIYFDSLYYVNAFNGSIIKRMSTSQTSFINNNNNELFTSCNNNIENNESDILHSKINSNSNSCNNSCNPGGVTIHYYGGQIINTSEFKYLGICTNRTKNNCNGATIYTRRRGNSNFEDYRSTNNSWPNQNDKVGITGHWCLEKTYEAFKNLFGLNSFDNNFSQINLLIDNQGQSLWDNSRNAIFIGKFQGTSSYQTVLDIVAHEFGHGVMINSSGLQGGMDLSSLTALNISANKGAVSEGFADIFGQLVENYVNNNYTTSSSNLNDFVHGGDRPGGYQCNQTRSLINPPQTCNPNTIFGSNYLPPLTLANNVVDFDNYIHQNSTILSHWFFLLSQGGSGTNEKNDNFCVKAIGQTKAGNVAFLAATHFIANYSKDFFGARSACIAAATQLFGVNSDEVAQVTEAWYAVGVGNKFSGQINVQNITVNNSGIVDVHYNAKVNVNNVTVNNNGTTFYITSNTEIEVLPTVDFNQGIYADLYIAPPNPCSSGARMNNQNSNPRNYENGNNELNNISLNGKIVNNETFEFSIQPNPNNGNFILTLDNNYSLPNYIVVRDALGKEVKIIQNVTEYQHNFNLNDLSTGLYLINAYYSDKTVSKRFIKN